MTGRRRAPPREPATGTARRRRLRILAPVDDRPTPLWLSHHPPDQYERCLRVGRLHVCRRCTLLYPLAFAVTAAALLTGSELTTGAAVAVVVLPVPCVVEFCLEQTGRIAYRPARQLATTAGLAVGLGIGFARYLRDLTDPLFWGTVVVYGGTCLGFVIWRVLDESEY